MRFHLRLAVSFAGLLLVLGAAAAGAVEFRAGQAVTIAAGEVIDDDLYAVGETVTIDGTVHGDVVAVGRHLTLNGSATGDVIAAGQGVVINGGVGDDVRIAGMVLRLGNRAAVADDVVAAGFSFESDANSATGGSLLLSGFQALLAGEVRERLLGELANLRVEGTIEGGGEVKVEGGGQLPPFMQFIPTPVPIPTVPGGFTVGEEAKIGENFVYTSPQRAIEEGDSDAALVHVSTATVTADAPQARTPRWRRQLGGRLAILAVAALLVLAVPAWLRGRSQTVVQRPLAALGWGLAGSLAVPVALMVLLLLFVVIAVLLAVIQLKTLIAPTVLLILLVFGAVLATAWIGWFYLAPAVVSLGLGGLVLKETASRGRALLALLVGWLALSLLALIPLLGPLVGLLVALAGFGALLLWWR